MNTPRRRWGTARLPETVVSPYAAGVLYTLGAGAALGTLGPISNVAYDAGMGSPTFAALRATIGALMLVAVTHRHGPRVAWRFLSAHDRAAFAIALSAQALLQLTLFAAFEAMTIALVLAVYFSYPLIVAAFSIALGRERLTATRTVALVLCIGGLLVVVLGRLGPAVEASFVGLALAAAAGTCQATYLVVARHGFASMPSTQAITTILVGVAITTWIVAVPVDASAGRLVTWVAEPAAWAAILFAGVVGAGLAKVWVLKGVRRVGGTRASVLLLTEPATGVVLAVVLLSQPFGPPEIVGGAGILAGAILAQRPTVGVGRTAD